MKEDRRLDWEYWTTQYVSVTAQRNRRLGILFLELEPGVQDVGRFVLVARSERGDGFGVSEYCKRE